MELTEMINEFSKGNRVDSLELFENYPFSFWVVKKILEENNAFWKHDGKPSSPHAKLTSGNCSDGYIDCSLILNKPLISEFLAAQLVFKIRSFLPDTRIDRVIGSPNAGITFAHDVAKMLRAECGFPEKDPDSPTEMRWKRWTIQPEENVLHVEELTTTGKTLMNVRNTIDRDNPQPVSWLPWVGILVYRPSQLSANIYGYKLLENLGLISLFETEIGRWSPEECPLCAKGSTPLRPKYHWQELTASQQ